MTNCQCDRGPRLPIIIKRSLENERMRRREGERERKRENTRRILSILIRRILPRNAVRLEFTRVRVNLDAALKYAMKILRSCHRLFYEKESSHVERYDRWMLRDKREEARKVGRNGPGGYVIGRREGEMETETIATNILRSRQNMLLIDRNESLFEIHRRVRFGLGGSTNDPGFGERRRAFEKLAQSANVKNSKNRSRRCEIESRKAALSAYVPNKNQQTS